MDLSAGLRLGPAAGPALGSSTSGQDGVLSGIPIPLLRAAAPEGWGGTGHAAAGAVLWGRQGSAQQHLFLM